MFTSDFADGDIYTLDEKNQVAIIDICEYFLWHYIVFTKICLFSLFYFGRVFWCIMVEGYFERSRL